MNAEQLKRFMEQHRADVLDELRKSSVLEKPEDAVQALDYTVSSLLQISKHMATIDYGCENPCTACGRKGISPSEAGKTTAYMAKVVNELWRLIDFARGKADHRTEVTGVGELMKVLTDEQFQLVNKWYEEGLAQNRRPN